MFTAYGHNMNDACFYSQKHLRTAIYGSILRICIWNLSKQYKLLNMYIDVSVQPNLNLRNCEDNRCYDDQREVQHISTNQQLLAYCMVLIVMRYYQMLNF